MSVAIDCEKQKAEVKRAINLVKENVDVIDNVVQMQQKIKSPKEVIPKIIHFSEHAVKRLEETKGDCEPNAPGVYPRSLCKEVEDILHWMKENVRKCKQSPEECFQEAKKHYEGQDWWKGLPKEEREHALKQRKEDCQKTQRWHCVYVADGITSKIHQHEEIPLLLSKGNRAILEAYMPHTVYLVRAYKDLFEKDAKAAMKNVSEAKKSGENAKVIYNEYERKRYHCKLR